MVQISILNYNTATVDLYTIPDVDDVENYMETYMEYDMNNCLWMCHDNIEINDERENS